MNCKHCGKPIRKGERFILVGTYPSHWNKQVSAFPLLKPVGPEDYGEMYHEACYSLHSRESLKEGA